MPFDTARLRKITGARDGGASYSQQSDVHDAASDPVKKPEPKGSAGWVCTWEKKK